jgi:hypothetical protein
VFPDDGIATFVVTGAESAAPRAVAEAVVAESSRLIRAAEDQVIGRSLDFPALEFRVSWKPWNRPRSRPGPVFGGTVSARLRKP